jgi:hypothetical protein
LGSDPKIIPLCKFARFFIQWRERLWDSIHAYSFFSQKCGIIIAKFSKWYPIGRLSKLHYYIGICICLPCHNFEKYMQKLDAETCKFGNNMFLEQIQNFAEDINLLLISSRSVWTYNKVNYSTLSSGMHRKTQKKNI